MEITTRTHKDVTVIEVEGDVDLSTSPRMRAAILEGFKRKEGRVLVDLTYVRHIDSSGLATLVEGLQLANRGGGRFAICGVENTVRDVFAIAHLGDVFDIYQDQNQAFSSL
ncbi:STAS domain-containing protein [bacterium]|nr:STAS domain-containing protein [bacterium]